MKSHYYDDEEFSLEGLKRNRVVSFKYEDGIFLITEECDTYFDAELTKVEFAQLIRDLQELYEQSE